MYTGFPGLIARLPILVVLKVFIYFQNSYNYTIGSATSKRPFDIFRSYMVPVKNILVTGGAGYLGSVLVRKLVARNFNVTVIDKMLFDTQTLNRFRDDIRIYKEDIRNDKEISKIFKKNKIDCVIHLAALVGDGICNIHPQEAVEINYLATKSLLDIARENKVRKFLFASTCSVYGFSDKLLKETDKVTPVSFRSLSEKPYKEQVDA